MDYKQLQTFVEVTRTKSFSDAADRLGISQPTVSIHIKNLEDELNAQLLVRTARTFELTPKGKEVLEGAEGIIEIWDGLQKRLNGSRSKMIRVGASTIPSAYILPRVLPRYGEIEKDVYFIINQSDSQGVVDSVKKGLCDIGLIGMKVRDDSIQSKRFFKDKMVVITPVQNEYLELMGKPFSKNVLKEKPMIFREAGSGSRKSAVKYLEDKGIFEEDLNIAARVNDQESIKNLVAGGLGISIVSEIAVEDYVREKRVLSFPLTGDTAGREFFVVYNKEYRMKEHVKMFVDYLVKLFSK